MINQMLLEQLQRNVHSFIRTVRTLSTEQFLTKMNGWAPRDVTAHLIGWNRARLTVRMPFAAAKCRRPGRPGRGLPQDQCGLRRSI